MFLVTGEKGNHMKNTALHFDPLTLSSKHTELQLVQLMI